MHKDAVEKVMVPGQSVCVCVCVSFKVRGHTQHVPPCSLKCSRRTATSSDKILISKQIKRCICVHGLQKSED